MEETPRPSKAGTAAAPGLSSGTRVAKAKPSYREPGSPVSLLSLPLPSPVPHDRAAASKRSRHNATKKSAGGGSTEALHPSPLELLTTENNASSKQGTTKETTESATVATAAAVACGCPCAYNRSITSTEGRQSAVVTPCWTSSLHNMLAFSLPTAAAGEAVAGGMRVAAHRRAPEQRSAPRVSSRERAMQRTLAHVLQRERVRALTTHALHLWLLHRVVRQHGRRRGDRESAAEVVGGHGPSASWLAWTPPCGVGIGVRCCSISTDADNVDIYAGSEVPQHTALQRREPQQHRRGRRFDDSSPLTSDAHATSASATTEEAAASVRRRCMVQHLLCRTSSPSPSRPQCLSNWLPSGVGVGAVSNFDDSFCRSQSQSQSDMEMMLAVQEGVPLRRRRPHSVTGGGAGPIASNVENRLTAPAMNTPQRRQADEADSPSSASGPLKDHDFMQSGSTSPMPMITATTLPQLLAHEAEDRREVQATEDRRRFRLQHGMSAVMDQLMMAVLHHRSGERGLHPSLRTSAAPSPVPLEGHNSSDDDDGRDADLLCTCATEAESEGHTWSGARAIGSVAATREPPPSSSPRVQKAATSRTTQRRLNYDSDVVHTQQHPKRGGHTEEEGCLRDVTAEHAGHRVSLDNADTFGTAIGLSERSLQVFGSTSQWGVHLLEPVTITSGSDGSGVPVTLVESRSHTTPC
ncbi:hypothetical protein, unknown function [Leishmania tarentolae]|uniref:Uncharacterized protein n=1 Tax=Leishmania tarentolae TaxID=5689 RepID=A0A640K7Y3_LEITA|nr:hypothetical protein, unknown function [Leishmania tarentolae]